jgi:DNA-binding CsgD family transcriptional regulator
MARITASGTLEAFRLIHGLAEILQQIADRVPTREIAAESNISQQVIKNYTYRAAQKLGADNRGHLIAVTFREGTHRTKSRQQSS